MLLKKKKWVIKEIKEEIKKHLEMNDNENDLKSMGHSKCSSKREVYRNASLPQETRKISKQSNLTTKGARKRRINKSQSQQKKRNHKEIETKDQWNKDLFL